MYAEEDKYYSNGKGTHSSPPQVRLPATKPDLQATPDAEGRPGTPRADGLLDEPSIADCDIPSASLSKNQKQKLRKKLNLKKWKTGLEATEAAKDPDELPAAAFAPTVNENTSFSPLDPTVPLQEDFGVLTPQTPPPSKPVLTVQILPQPRREFPRDPSAPPTRPQSPSEVELEKLPIPELPSPVPPIPDAPTPPARPPFESVRPALFQKAFFDSINGAKFDDTQVYLCSARSKAGVAHKPMVVYVRSEFLHAASAIFTDEIYDQRTLVDIASLVGWKSDRAEYGYDCDSDLEECEEEVVEKKPIRRASASSRPAPSRNSTSKEAPPKSAVSATLSATDIDMVSLADFDSAVSLSDDTEDIAAARGKRVVPKSALSMETNDSILRWRDEHLQDTVIPIADEKLEVAEVQPSVEETIVFKRKCSRQERTLFITDSAYRTWQALLLYLYNDFLEFAPLRTQKQPRLLPLHGVSCSPKSMYRLATKLGLEKLQEQSFHALEQALSKENIVEELFSDFTWRYPEVLQMETDVFHRCASEPAVQNALQDKFQDIAYGQLPHSSVVLNSLFQKFITMTAGQRK